MSSSAGTTHGLLALLLALSLAGSFLNLFPSAHWIHEVNTNLGAYYLVAHILSIPLALFVFRIKRLRRTLLTLLLGVLSLWYLIALYPFYFSSLTQQEEGGVSLLYANVYLPNTNHVALADIIARENPDLVALLETDEVWLNALALAQRYPFRIEIPQPDQFGLSLYSRHPFIGAPLRSLGGTLPPLILQRVEISPGKEVVLGLLHARPPVSSGNFWTNKYLLRRFATLLRHSEENFVIAGDFNATPFSFFYRRFVHWTGVKDSRWGQGLYRSWNTRLPFFRLAIDHIFYRGAVQVTSFSRLEDFGSDHYPFLIRFVLP